jgi:hypothetical protein
MTGFIMPFDFRHFIYGKHGKQFRQLSVAKATPKIFGIFE